MSKQDIHFERQASEGAKPKRGVDAMEWDFEVSEMHVDGPGGKKREEIELPVNWEDIPLP